MAKVPLSAAVHTHHRGSVSARTVPLQPSWERARAARSSPTPASAQSWCARGGTPPSVAALPFTLGYLVSASCARRRHATNTAASSLSFSPCFLLLLLLPQLRGSGLDGLNRRLATAITGPEEHVPREKDAELFGENGPFWTRSFVWQPEGRACAMARGASASLLKMTHAHELSQTTRPCARAGTM